MAIQTVTLIEFKTHVDDYLSKAKEGQIIAIISRGKLVAQVFPPVRSLKERSKDLQKAGIIEWSGQKLPRRKPVATNRSKKLASDIIVEMRD